MRAGKGHGLPAERHTAANPSSFRPDRGAVFQPRPPCRGSCPCLCGQASRESPLSGALAMRRSAGTAGPARAPGTFELSHPLGHYLLSQVPAPGSRACFGGQASRESPPSGPLAMRRSAGTAGACPAPLGGMGRGVPQESRRPNLHCQLAGTLWFTGTAETNPAPPEVPDAAGRCRERRQPIPNKGLPLYMRNRVHFGARPASRTHGEHPGTAGTFKPSQPSRCHLPLRSRACGPSLSLRTGLT